VEDVHLSTELQSLHTLQRRLGEHRRADERPYEAVIKGLSSLRTSPSRRRRMLVCLRRRRT